MFVSSFQIISRPDSQSQLQMFTLFSVCHVGGAKSSTNLHWRLHIGHTGLCKFAKNISMNIWSLEKRRDRKLGEMPSLFMSYNILFSWLHPLNIVFFFFRCVTVKTIKNKYQMSPLISQRNVYGLAKRSRKLHFISPFFEPFLDLFPTSFSFLFFLFLHCQGLSIFKRST